MAGSLTVTPYDKITDIVLTTFQVPLWITFNEAFVVSWLGYGIGMFAPGIYDPGVGVYKVAHNIVRSHTKAYHTYDQHFKRLYRGRLQLLYTLARTIMRFLAANQPSSFSQSERHK